MHLTAPASSIDFELPGWLQECLNAQRTLAETTKPETAKLDPGAHESEANEF